jgi:hypothetical protein
MLGRRRILIGDSPLRTFPALSQGGDLMICNRWATCGFATAAIVFAAVSNSLGAFHLWQVKEVFSNADGSVQFIEMFDSFGGETFVNGLTLTANSDGNLKTFTFPSNLSNNTPGSLLIATSGFGSLAGGVTPDFAFNQGGVSGAFFNPNATTLTFTFSGSGDSMSFPGTSLPKNGINSLTDAGAVGAPPGTPNISASVNSPTNLLGSSGSVNLSTPSPTGDYNGNHTVDAADYVVWRSTLTKTVSAGTGADGNGDGTVNAADYTFWRARFGNAAGSGSSFATAQLTPEPATCALLMMAVVAASCAKRRGR